jgi:hypothetical protein
MDFHFYICLPDGRNLEPELGVKDDDRSQFEGNSKGMAWEL